MPIKKREIQNKYEIIPNDWKSMSEVTLPLKPNKFCISLFFGIKKFGSSGEWVNKDKIRKKDKIPYKSLKAKNLIFKPHFCP